MEIYRGPVIVKRSGFGGCIPAHVATHVICSWIERVVEPEVELKVIWTLEDQVFGPPSLFRESQSTVEANRFIKVPAGEYRNRLLSHQAGYSVAHCAME